MGLDDRVAQMQSNGAPILPSAAPMQNPPGFQYTPNVNGQMVVAPPGHPAHAGVPAGYQYPPGAVPVAGGVVEVPAADAWPATAKPQGYTDAPNFAFQAEAAARMNLPQTVEVVTLPPGAAAAAERLAEHVAEAVEKPKRTRRTKAEIEAEKAEKTAARIEEYHGTADDGQPVDGGLDNGIIVTREGSDLTHVVGIADAALEALSQKSKSLGCDVQVNFSFKGSQS